MTDGFSLYDDCVMVQLSDEVFANCEQFTCGNADLDDFFVNDAQKYAEELMGKTYCWITDVRPHKIVAFYTLSNDSIKTTHLEGATRNRISRAIRNRKRGRSYPATLIGRLGISREFQGMNLGSQLIRMALGFYTGMTKKRKVTTR